jgi:hypothetical protein
VGRVPRSRIYGYKYDYSTSVRLGRYEKVMLDKLIKLWQCSEAEAIRRCIVYTFSKYVAKLDKLDEDSIMRALHVALGGLINETSGED